MKYDDLFFMNGFKASQPEKNNIFLAALKESVIHHYNHCDLYQTFCNKHSFNPYLDFTIEQLPFLPIDIFKKLDLQSITPHAAVKEVRSSATTSQTPSKVKIDQITRTRQIKSLVSILQAYIGNKRRPFIILDTKPTSSTSSTLSARSAAMNGFLNAASSVEYCMVKDQNNKLKLDVDKFTDLINKYEQQEGYIIFGYTYIVYAHVASQLIKSNQSFNLKKAQIMHIGGWKKLKDEAVSQQKFNRTLSQLFGIHQNNILDIYGFTEQLGLVYISRGNQPKQCPIFSEIIIRCPQTLEPVKDGTEGLIEMITPLPYSYPGIAILLDDMGVITSRDPSKNGFHGTSFKVIGRAERNQIRGCGDVYATEVSHDNS